MTSCCVAETEQYVLLSPRTEQQANLELTVAEKRRALALLRRGWEEVHVSRRQRPMYISSSLGLAGAPELSFEDFALRFVLLHHSKRATPATDATEEPEEDAQKTTAEAGTKQTARYR